MGSGWGIAAMFVGALLIGVAAELVAGWFGGWSEDD